MSNRTAGKWHWRNLPYLLAYALARLGAWVQMEVLAVALCLPLVASRHPSILEQVQESGELVVLSRNGPTTYYEDSTGLTGFEYHLAKAFADQLGVKLVIKEVEDLDDPSAPGYPVITGEYSAAPRWERTPVVVGAEVTRPSPIFTKLDTSVVEEERARLGLVDEAGV